MGGKIPARSIGSTLSCQLSISSQSLDYQPPNPLASLSIREMGRVDGERQPHRHSLIERNPERSLAPPNEVERPCLPLPRPHRLAGTLPAIRTAIGPHRSSTPAEIDQVG